MINGVQKDLKQLKKRNRRVSHSLKKVRIKKKSNLRIKGRKTQMEKLSKKILRIKAIELTCVTN